LSDMANRDFQISRVCGDPALRPKSSGNDGFVPPPSVYIPPLVGAPTEIRLRPIIIPDEVLPAYFTNTQQTYTAACPDGFAGDPVTVVIPQGVFTSEVSAADANAQAFAVAKEQAESGLVCEQSLFFNTEQSYTAVCTEETFLGEFTATIPAGTFSSAVSQADANAQALDAAIAQAEAGLVCVFDTAPCDLELSPEGGIVGGGNSFECYLEGEYDQTLPFAGTNLEAHFEGNGLGKVRYEPFEIFPEGDLTATDASAPSRLTIMSYGKNPFGNVAYDDFESYDEGIYAADPPPESTKLTQVFVGPGL